MKKVISAAILCAMVVTMGATTAFAHGCHGGNARTATGTAAAQTDALCSVTGCELGYSHMHDGVTYGGHTVGDGHGHAGCATSGCYLTGDHSHGGYGYCR